MIPRSLESLDELEKIVVPLYSKIENKKVKKLIYPYKYHPFGPDQLKRIIFIQSQSNMKVLRLLFPTPDVSHQYKTAVSLQGLEFGFFKNLDDANIDITNCQPDRYVRNFIESKRPKGLISLLNDTNLCTDVDTNYEAMAGIGLFGIQCDLTDHGVRNGYLIVKIIFQVNFKVQFIYM